jgi:DNA-binding IclR family transcriptional regulator
MAVASDDGMARRARGLDRAFDILDFLRRCRRPMRPNEIAGGIEAPRSSVYELVNLMLRRGVLDYSGPEGRVYLGRKLYYLGAAYADHFDFMRECDAVLARLAEETRETAQMGLLEGDKYSVARMKEGARTFRLSSRIGEPIALPWTASGRLLVGHLADEAIVALIPPEDFTLPNGEFLAPELFIREVREAQRRGYCAVDSVTDSFTHCFAVPVYGADRASFATLSLVAPRSEAALHHAAYLEALLRAAARLSHGSALGQPS